MRSLAVVMSVAVVAGAAVWAQTPRTTPGPNTAPAPMSTAVDKGARWLASVQGADGGWGQDGGEPSSARPGERLESSGNDVANTAVAALALLQAGRQYQPQVERALAFILQRVEASPVDGLAITDRQGTQIQRKLGPCIDTFLSAMLLSQIDGRASTAALNARVRKGLQKTVAKIEKHQQSDGSWNIAGGWAPVLGTSMASRSLFEARNKGVAVDAAVLKRAENYTVSALSAPPPLGATPGQFGPSWDFDPKGADFGEWLRHFQAQVRRNWLIPYAAMILHGHVVLRVTIHRDGAITDVTVLQPAELEAFTKASVNALQASAPAAPLPQEYPDEKVVMAVTFYYNEKPPK